MRSRLLPFLLMLCASATAGATRVIPMVPVIKPSPSLEMREKFQEAVARGLGGDAVPTNEVRMRLMTAQDLFDCTGGPCIPRVATIMRGDRIVTTEITQTGKTYAIKVHVFDADGKELGRGVEETCDICTVREADEAVQKAAGKAAPMIAMASTPPPAPKPVTPPTPPPARAEEGGPEGPRATPLEPAPSPVTPTPATPPKVAAPTPTPDQPPVATPQPPDKKEETGGFPYRPVAYGAFGLAGVSLIATIAFGVYAGREGNGSCDVMNPTRHDPRCPAIYQGNAVPAAMFGVVTVLAAGTGVLLLILDSRRHKDSKKTGPTVTAAPLRDGFAVGASLEF